MTFPIYGKNVPIHQPDVTCSTTSIYMAQLWSVDETRFQMGPHHTTRGTYGAKMVVEGMDVTSLKHDKKKGHLILDTSNIRMSFYLDKTSLDWNKCHCRHVFLPHQVRSKRKHGIMVQICPDQETKKFWNDDIPYLDGRLVSLMIGLMIPQPSRYVQVCPINIHIDPIVVTSWNSEPLSQSLQTTGWTWWKAIQFVKIKLLRLSIFLMKFHKWFPGLLLTSQFSLG